MRCLVQLLRSTPESYHKGIHLSIKKCFTKIDEIIKVTSNPAGPKLSELPLNKEVKDSLTFFLEVTQVSIEEDLPSDDTSLLLYRPAGTGKTLIANAIARELGAPLIMVTPAEALSKWSGESPKYIRDVLKRAKAERAVLFIDEIHKLTNGQNGEESSCPTHTGHAPHATLPPTSVVSFCKQISQPAFRPATSRSHR